MLSIANHVLRRTCADCSEVNNKATYIHQYLPWVDLAIGIILLVTAALASNGVIPIGGTHWMYAFGAMEVALFVLGHCTKFFTCSYHTCRSAVKAKMRGEGFCNVFGETVSQIPPPRAFINLYNSIFNRENAQ